MIIGVSGKIGSGKDTVGKIIQYLTSECSIENLPCYRPYNKWLEKQTGNLNFEPHYISIFNIKKFADKLKDIVCLLINCTREQLENHEFKNTPLGEDWIRYAYAIGHNTKNGQTTMWSLTCSKEKYEEEKRINWQTAYKDELTPRTLLQLLGTECGRDTIHNNIWVNALMSEYKPIHYLHKTLKNNYVGLDEYNNFYPEALNPVFPSWVITDMRFPNEMEAVKERNGITIRVNRKCKNCNNIINSEDDHGIGCCEATEGLLHESEIALDNAEFDYTINNDDTIEELIEKVREILIKEKII
jgi:hypothetical protein